jgi:hypothetical protein
MDRIRLPISELHKYIPSGSILLHLFYWCSLTYMYLKQIKVVELMKLRDDQYQQLVNHRGVIKMVAEQKLNVSNSPHDTMARVWMQLGQAPVNTNCNACVLQLYADINNLMIQYENGTD